MSSPQKTGWVGSQFPRLKVAFQMLLDRSCFSPFSCTDGRAPSQISSPRSVVLVYPLPLEEPVTLTLLLVPVAFPQPTTRHSVHSTEPMLRQAARPVEKRLRMIHRSLA